MSCLGPVLIVLIASLGTEVAKAAPVPSPAILPSLRQPLSLLSAETFKTEQGKSVRDDCEFAAAVIRTYSRSSAGLRLESRCEYQPKLKDFLVRTEVVMQRAPETPNKPFRKVTSRVIYQRETSARYAARILRQLNFHESNVLMDPVRSGRAVALDAVALIGAGRSPRVALRGTAR